MQGVHFEFSSIPRVEETQAVEEVGRVVRVAIVTSCTLGWKSYTELAFLSNECLFLYSWLDFHIFLSYPDCNVFENDMWVY